MKQLLLTLAVTLGVHYSFFSQEKELSSASQFIDRSTFIQINIDENEKAIFKSGLGETVEFYPAEIIDLKTDQKMYGLTVESTFAIGQQGMTTIQAREVAWVGIEEIGDMIIWLEKYVVPNLEQAAGKKKTIKYVFNTKEITLKFEVVNSTQIFSVILNHSLHPDKYFWTEAKVKDIPKVLIALKSLESKKTN
jgi:hypothetical protein